MIHLLIYQRLHLSLLSVNVNGLHVAETLS